MIGKGIFNSGIGVAKNEYVKKGLMGIGAASILSGILTQAAPSVANKSGMIIPAVVGTAAGGLVGGLAAVAANHLASRTTATGNGNGNGGFA